MDALCILLRKGYDRVSVMRPGPGDKVRLLKSFSAICAQSAFLSSPLTFVEGTCLCLNLLRKLTIYEK